MTYFHCDFCRFEMVWWYWSRARWRLKTLSGASNNENTQLLRTEFGFSVLMIWKDIFTDDPPLSPPSLIHTSFGGMTPLCQVSWFNLLISKFMHEIYYLFKLNLPILFIKQMKNNTSQIINTCKRSWANLLATLSCGESKRYWLCCYLYRL